MFEALIPWEPSLLIPLCLIVAAVVYARGSAGDARWRQVCFWSGLFGYYTALFTQFDYAAEHLFFVHRLQHSLIHHVAPFLIALSQPSRALIAGLPPSLRGWTGRLKALSWLNRPVVAVCLFCALIAIFLIPSVHFYAMLDVRLYKLMNALMVINGLMFWTLMLNGALSPAVRIVMMLAIVPPQIVIGFLLVMAGRDLYPLYDLCGRTGGFDAVTDQTLGGAVIWLSAMMMSGLGIVVVVARGSFTARRPSGSPAYPPPSVR